MLHHLQRSTEDSTAEVGLGIPEATLEAVGPATEPCSIRDKSTLVFLVGDNLSEFGLDVDGVGGLATDTGQSVNGLWELALLDKVSRRVGEHHKTTSKDDSPGELDGDGDTVGASVGALLGSVDDAGSKHDTDGNAELVTGDEGTTDLAGALGGSVSESVADGQSDASN